MLRAILVGLLSLSAVNCKSHDATVTAQPGVAAGSVIQVSGTVTLHHGDAARPLAKGDTVEGDDIVETGADGSVVIELAHNHAAWELGANKKSKVRESLAWTAPKKDTSAKAVDEDSAAAGRHAERSAADTAESGGAKDVAVTAAPPANLERDDDSAPAKTAQVDEKKSEEKKPVERERKKSPLPPPPPAPGGGSKGDVTSADRAMVGASAGPSPKDGTPPPKTTIIAKQATQSPMAPPTVQATESMAMPPPAGGGGDGGGGGASPETAALDLLQTKHTQLNACLGTKLKTLHVVIKIDAKGKATPVFDAGTDAAVKTCVTKVVGTLKFAASAVSATLQIKP